MAIVEIKGLDEIQRALNKLRLPQDEVDDLCFKPPLNNVALQFIKHTK